MLLQPNERWYWYFDHEQNRLMLELSDEMLFATAYQKAELIPRAQDRQSFSIEDTRDYYQLTESLNELQWAAPYTVQLMINAIAVRRFYKPKLPQSWFFIPNREAFMPQPNQLCCLRTQMGEGCVLIVEVGSFASICLLIDTDLSLSSTRQLGQFGVIKVMNDRLWPLFFHSAENDWLKTVG